MYTPIFISVGAVLVVFFIVMLFDLNSLPYGTRPAPTTKRPDLPRISLESSQKCLYCGRCTKLEDDACPFCGAPFNKGE